MSFDGGLSTSILDSALQCGYHFEYSCKSGQCGVCKTSLLKGEVTVLSPQLALTEADKREGKILTCCCAPESDIEIDAEDLTALKNIEVKTLPARISSLKYHTEDLVEVSLRIPPAAKLDFLEGQYIDVIVAGGIRRSYSIANAANQSELTLFIKRVPQGVLSKYWFEQAKENDLLRVEGPKGSFFKRPTIKKELVFLATGTGIAPVKSMLDRLSLQDDLSVKQTIHLYWGNRTPKEFFWKPDYLNIEINFVPVLSRSVAEWQGRTGYVQDSVIADLNNLASAECYACGSMQMIESAFELFKIHGIEEKSFYSDAFVSS